MAQRRNDVPDFLPWLWQHIRLDRLDSAVHPALHIVKTVLAIAMTLLIDRFTKNPDSVSSTFTALLCVTPTIRSEWRTAKNIFSASMIGTLWGLACATLWNDVALNLTSVMASSEWLLIVRIPVAVAGTIYSLLLINMRDPGPQTAGGFTALYVQFVNYTWYYEPTWMSQFVLSTALVRVIALLTGIFAAFIVNLIASSFLLFFVFERQFKNIHSILDSAVVEMHDNPFSGGTQAAFSSLGEFEEDLQGAIEEMAMRHKMCIGDAAAKSRLHAHLTSCRADQQLLCVQQALSVMAHLSDIDSNEKRTLSKLFHSLTRRESLFPHKALVEEVTSEELSAAVKHGLHKLIEHVEGRAPLSIMMMEESPWLSQSRRSVLSTL